MQPTICYLATFGDHTQQCQARELHRHARIGNFNDQQTISNNKTQHTRQFSPLAIDLMQPPLSQRIADEMKISVKQSNKNNEKKENYISEFK